MSLIEAKPHAESTQPNIPGTHGHYPTESGTPTERVPRISLKQWRMFHAVVDNDGFVGAANKLHISQSSISHALAKMQDQLGVSLLVIRGRKAQITEEGKVLLTRSRELVRQAARLEEFGEYLQLGWEPVIRLAVEPNYPPDLLIRAFRDVSRHSKTIQLDVKEVSPAELQRLLHQEKVDLAIGSAPVPGFAGNKLIEVEHVVIAHADSPLFELNREITPADLTTHFRIVFCTGEKDSESPNASDSLHTQRSWTVSNLDSAAEALRFGLGYAWLPRYRVQRWLDDGWVRILPLKSGSSFSVQMHLIRSRSVVPGSGAQRFAEALQMATTERAACQGSLPAHDETGSDVHDARTFAGFVTDAMSHSLPSNFCNSGSIG